MSVLPNKLLERIQFLEGRIAGWQTNASALGSTTAKAAALATKISATRAGYDQQQQAFAAGKDATLNLLTLGSAMTTAAADFIKDVKAKAASDGDAIYVLASIPAPATPSPVAAPGTPDGWKVELLQNGALKLSWKCVNPKGATGTVYQVARQIGVSGTPQVIGASGTRSIVDSTLPPTAGAAAGGVTYSVTAIRSTKAGVAGETTVKFGNGAAGEMTASIVQGGPSGGAPKLAA